MKCFTGCKRAKGPGGGLREIAVVKGRAYFFFDKYYAVMETNQPEGTYSFRHLKEIKEWRILGDKVVLDEKALILQERIASPLATCTIPLPYLSRALLFSLKDSTWRRKISRYFLNTLAFDWNDRALVTTDGISLYRYKGGSWEGNLEGVLLLPNIKPLEKATEVSFYKDFWSFLVGELTFFGEYTAGQFPRYKAVIPENFGDAEGLFNIPDKKTLSFEKKKQKLDKEAFPYIQAREDFGFVIELLERLATCKVPFVYTQGNKVAGYKNEKELFLVMPKIVDKEEEK